MSADPKMPRIKPGGERHATLRMVNPEWITSTPDARARRHLESLLVHGLTRQNFGRWYITDKGREVLEQLDEEERAAYAAKNAGIKHG